MSYYSHTSNAIAERHSLQLHANATILCIAGCKPELSGLLLPLHLRLERLGPSRALSTDSKYGQWHDLRHRWDGSLAVFTAQQSSDLAASAIVQMELARLCSLLRYGLLV